MNVNIPDLIWGSDWNGYEVGYDDISVVGFYTSESLACSFYIDAETGDIIEVMTDFEDDF